ncbi:MAG TPA: S9 family peptidase [Steroidobacteraceae bacterium]|jgi:dipeptidyl aminopeptidase/acylaminoacyl peptidase|nr:S9 family peptidase [Steroidobacteraceae bacterium]
MTLKRLPLAALALSLSLAPLAAQAGRALSPDDWYRFQDVSDIRVAPDGAAVAYLVTSYDKESDESRAALWLTDWSGKDPVQLTRGESVSEPRFSPDGHFLSFLSARPAGGATQLWLLDRRGGEPRQLTHGSSEITSYEWSPDASHIVLVSHAGEAGGGDDSAHSAPRPLVVDAYHFKQDRAGYLTAGSRSHLSLLEVASGNSADLTAETDRAESLPVFSPDGHTLAFVGNDAVNRSGAGRDDIELLALQPGAQPKRLLSTWSPNHQKLQWSPDGRQLAFLQGAELRYNAYIMDALAVADVTSGRVRVLTASLDRAVLSPQFSADGGAIQFAVEDDGQQYPAQVRLADGAIERLAGPIVVNELSTAAGHTAVLAGDDHAPFEVFALEGGKLRPLSAHNRGLFAELALGTVEDIAFASRDGTQIHAQIVKPPDYVPGRRYPTIVWIHGGPNGQDDHSLLLESYGPQLERQLFATHGYVVLAVNYRGGTGRGAKFARSILADWGHLEVEDLRAAVDWAIAAGIADPGHLGIGGWSYGGLLTDYTIASDTRFKAAISGAGSGNQLSTYGSDEYVVEYDAELGPPWKNTALWLKVSYPFFHADRIRTPTLFLGGDKDFNVPIIGGEQMYQALRALGVPAELIVYPGEHHTLDRPSFLVDRYERYLEWMKKYLDSPP